MRVCGVICALCAVSLLAACEKTKSANPMSPTAVINDIPALESSIFVINVTHNARTMDVELAENLNLGIAANRRLTLDEFYNATVSIVNMSCPSMNNQGWNVEVQYSNNGTLARPEWKGKAHFDNVPLCSGVKFRLRVRPYASRSNGASLSDWRDMTFPEMSKVHLASGYRIIAEGGHYYITTR